MKNNLLSFGIGALTYLLLILLAYFNFELFKFAPILIVLGTCGTYLLLGCLLDKKGIWGSRIAIFLTYIGAGIIYAVGRGIQSTELITVFRRMVPQVYHSIGKLGGAIGVEISRDVDVAIGLAVLLIVALGMLELGRIIRGSKGQAWGVCYNLILTGTGYFYLFMITHIIVMAFPTLMNDSKQKMIFGAIMTIVIFVTCFFLGKLCRTLQSRVLQCLSSCGITVMLFVLYGLGVFLIWDIGIYERYMLPVATSYIGTLCRSLGVVLGAKAQVISQYGVVASSLMILAPTLLIIAGKFSSLDKTKTEEVEVLKEIIIE
ncbi:hypothetical protein PBV87_22080 [Niameybacter massiliensis]|uniref:Uncharacterized protein n=1 Tax=Holtiella tumoricola TaxID=3018743 RepID=A0AA42J3C9_9FIRM|nr:hypothetical protein [Holtiella tumoricola]MDA3734165.1 hypothetical protein [Holtiella tumoricola]